MVGQTLAHVFDKRPIKTLDSALGLRSVSHARPLFGPFDLAHAFEEGRRKFPTIVGRKEARRADEAREVLKRSAHSFGVLVLQLIKLDITRECVDEDQHILVTQCRRREHQKVTNDPVPNVFCLKGDTGCPIRRNWRAFLIAGGAVADMLLNIFVDVGPDGIPLELQQHFVCAGVPRDIIAVHFMEDFPSHRFRDDGLEDSAVDSLAIRFPV